MLILIAALLPVAAAQEADLASTVERVSTKLLGGDPCAVSVTAYERDERYASIHFVRTGADAFELHVASRDATFRLERTAARCVLALPTHGVAFTGSGELGDDSLAPRGFAGRLLGAKAAAIPVGVAMLLRQVRAGADLGVELALGAGGALEIRGELLDDIDRIELTILDGFDSPTTELRAIAVERAELERMLARGLRRLLQIYVAPLAPDDGALLPRRVAHGELRIVDGQRVALLAGTPQQIGTAHAKLLGPHVRRTIDSCLYLVGAAETVRSGHWFPGVLRDAWKRLSPHIPKRHIAELDAIAAALPDVGTEELRLANVFPEYFHCSGFAVAGPATKSGKLYHGRVLDYMTVIGLQQAAVTFVVKPNGHHAFLNVGYAGFGGSVTGMNDQQISLGEMGGGGRFEWNGVPMATLMRRALEECDTLDEVQALWRDSPRTCEYYYVFADGKTRRAVGVAATPEQVDFVAQGEDHPELGAGIPGTVVLSAGDRLEKLRERILEGHGKIDEAAAIELMARPVAMSSNLHSALMVPEDGVCWVAQATNDRPAAETRYARIDFRALLEDVKTLAALRATDTFELRVGERDPRAMLGELAWQPGSFDVRLDESGALPIVSFPSPKPIGDARNDRVALEWHRPRGDGERPAMIVLHILAGNMRIARGIARSFAMRGIHGFVMHLPGYGLRGDERFHRDPTLYLARAQQGAADARRARDAIATLPGVARGRIGIQGTSLGALIAALAAGLDRGFDPVFLALAGGDLVSMLENGKRDAAKVRRRILGSGIGVAEMNRQLRAIDPARLAHRLDAERTWLYSAENDTVVPPANARLLGTAAGLSEHNHRWFAGDHYTCAVHLPRIVQHMVAVIHAPR